MMETIISLYNYGSVLHKLRLPGDKEECEGFRGVA